LNDEYGISLRGLEEIKRGDLVFAEFYTNVMPGLSIPHLEALTDKQIKILSRWEIEENAEHSILTAAQEKRVCLLVPGDPMTATTHLDLRLRAAKMNITTRVIHAASIETAIPGTTGLQSYKFGRSVTVPFIDEGLLPESIYNYCKENVNLGLHTLILLDIKADEGRFMSIPEAVQILSKLESEKEEGVFSDDRLMIGVARLGGHDVQVKGDFLNRLSKFEFGGPPHCLIAPGRLHFMEVEALKILAETSKEVFEYESRR
jgi:diphthine synthase